MTPEPGPSCWYDDLAVADPQVHAHHGHHTATCFDMVTTTGPARVTCAHALDWPDQQFTSAPGIDLAATTTVQGLRQGRAPVPGTRVGVIGHPKGVRTSTFMTVATDAALVDSAAAEVGFRPLVLQGELPAGYSGAPVISAGGTVVGMIFGVFDGATLAIPATVIDMAVTIIRVTMPVPAHASG